MSFEESWYLRHAVQHHLHLKTMTFGLFSSLVATKARPYVQVPLVLVSCFCFFLRHCSKYNNVSRQIFKIIDSDCVPRGRSQGPPRWLTADQRLPDLQHLFPPLLFHSLPYLVLQFLSATNLRFSIL